MKRMMILLVMALVMFSGNAFAATSANLDVSATVVGTCSIVGGTLDFPDSDTFQVGDTTWAATGVQVTCGNGISYTVSANAGLNGDSTMSPSGAVPTATPLSYSIDIPTPTGTGNGAAQDIVINGTITEAAVRAAVPDTYSDTVLLTIAP